MGREAIQTNTFYLIICLTLGRDILLCQNMSPDKAPEAAVADSITLPEEQPLDRDLWLGIGGGTGFLKSQKLYGLNEFVASFGGFIDDSRWLQFNGSLLHTPLRRTSDPEYAIKNGVSLVQIEVDFKFYTPARYSFLGHYFSFGAGLAFAFWDYDENGSFVGASKSSFDYLWGYDLHVGTGFVLGEFMPLTANLDITPGLILWGAGTEQGYSRAILPTFLYVKARIQLSYVVARW